LFSSIMISLSDLCDSSTGLRWCFLSPRRPVLESHKSLKEIMIDENKKIRLTETVHGAG